MTIQDYDISIEYCSGKNNLVADNLSCSSEKENAAKMANSNRKIILYALAKRPSSGLRYRLQNFAQEKKLDPILGQKIKDVEENKTTKYEIHDDLLYFVNGENISLK